MPWILAAVLLATPLAGSLHTLVLNSGQQFSLKEDVRIEEGLVIFRAAGGSLYSIPLSEVDLPRTERANEFPRREVKPAGPTRSVDQAQLDLERMLAERTLTGRPLVVSEEEKQRLIDEAAKSRGVPAPPPTPSIEIEVSAPATAASTTNTREEWQWRERARGYQERVRRAKEEFQLLVDKERRLQDEILGLLSLGYNGDQFNLQVLQLAYTRDSLPRAQMNVQRAERDLAQFMDDARRQGILPGWLR